MFFMQFSSIYIYLLLTVEPLSFTINFTKEVSPLPCRQAERFGVVQLGEKEDPEALHSTFQYLKEAARKLETDLHLLVPKGACRCGGDGLLTRACKERTRKSCLN